MPTLPWAFLTPSKQSPHTFQRDFDHIAIVDLMTCVVLSSRYKRWKGCQRRGMNGCTFCKLIAREIPGHVIDEDDALIVFLSLERHPLIAPKKHIQDLFTLDPDTASRIIHKSIEIARAMRRSTLRRDLCNPDEWRLRRTERLPLPHASLSKME